MKALFNIKKHKLVLVIFCTAFSSLNGVMISSIIISAGKLNNQMNIYDILTFGGKSLGIWVIVYFATYFASVTQASIIKDINLRIKQSYFESEFLNDKVSKDASQIISAVMNDLKLIETNFLEQIFSTFSNILLFFFSLSYMLYLNLVVSLVFIVFSLLPVIVPSIMGKRLVKSANDFSESSAAYSKILKEAFNGYQTVAIFSAEKGVLEYSTKRLVKMEQSVFELKKSEWLAKLLSSIISGFSFIIPFVIGSYLIIFKGTLSFSILIGIFLANDKVVGPIQSIVGSLSTMKTTKELRRKYFKYLQRSNGNLSAKDSKVEMDNTDIKCIELDSLRYNLNNGKTLNLDLKLKKPFRVLLTGESGSGKTTFLNLLNGTLRPQKGHMRVNGREIVNLKIPTVSQNPYIFDTSIRENITLFQNDLFSEDEIIEVLKKVRLYDELVYDGGLDYQCGEQGGYLSGGQKQKLALARLLIRNKAVYLLDEISANLDEKNSKIIHDLLFELDDSFIEVSHHYDLNDVRYTAVYKMTDEGRIEKLRE